jgi:nitric oxide reductase NorE protein
VSSAPEAYRDLTHRIPGEPGIWVVIFGDMMVFSVMFVSFVLARRDDRALFHASAARLSQPCGLVNTVLLLTSSWFVTTAVHAAREGRGRSAALHFRLAICCALGFVVTKMIEYSDKIRAGIVINTNDFYMYYYVLTGIHLLHVLIGLGLLFCMARYAAGGAIDAKRVGHLESGASFWHLVDLLWIALFALLYLLR